MRHSKLGLKKCPKSWHKFRKLRGFTALYAHVEQCVILLKTPQLRLDPQKNQNGTLAEDALLMEKFISAESVR